MAHIPGTDRSQLLLLPEVVDDYVGPDNAVRFIEAFVDQLDLKIAGFARVGAKATGRPGYDPADLLKLYIYGYLNRVRSSRRLEAETRDQHRQPGQHEPVVDEALLVDGRGDRAELQLARRAVHERRAEEQNGRAEAPDDQVLQPRLK